jgi:hypothetical protein
LTGVDLLHAFHGLNARFDTLLFVHFRFYRLDFRSISKTAFDVICRDHLLSIADRVISLRLSDDDDTPQQCNLFLNRGFNLRQFFNLRLISLCYLRSEQTMNKMMIELCHLPLLSRISFTNCYISYNQINAERMFNSIWSLVKLTHFFFDSYENNFPCPSVTSTSLEHLTVRNGTCSLSELVRLCRYTPRLRYLCVDINDTDDDQQLCSPILSITTFKFSIESSENGLQNLLQNMQNLCNLTVETWDIDTNGYQWEQTIVTHLPKLKIFRLKMRVLFRNKENRENEFNELLDSFRTRFWVIEHQWFVRCHWHSQSGIDFMYLYTLPYTLASFFANNSCILSKSTCPIENDHWSYDSVTSLRYEYSVFASSIMSQVRFSNIRYLTLSLPFNDQFLLVVPKLDKLISLNVSVHVESENVQSQLQFLLDRAPRLHSLSFDSWLPSVQIENTSTSVRRLDLQASPFYNDWCWFNDQRCAILSRSSLGVQCQTLLINVENRTNVLDLVNTMMNLRALNVQCKDDRWNDKNNPSSSEDELLEWLRHHLPSIYTITRDSYIINNIRLWIR